MAQVFNERFRAKRPNSSPLRAPEPDNSFSYLVGRAVSVFPRCNGNQAAFLEEDFKQTRGLKSFIGTDLGFKFGLVNANHSVGPGKPNVVLGSVREEAWSLAEDERGVDIVVQIDKRACAAYDVEPEDFIEKGGLNSFSIEIACDRDRSTFIAMTNPGSQKLEDQTVFTAEEAASLGVRRTSFAEPSPYLYKDEYMVVELCSPIRCRGVAVLPDPADSTANVFEVAASMEKPKSIKDRLKAAKDEEHLKRSGAVKDTLKEHGIKLTDDQDHALDRALGIADGGKLDALIDSITGADEEKAAKHDDGVLVPKKYASISDDDFADPGYRGKKRYPINDREHALAADRYFAKPENRGKYTAAQQKHIQDKIDAAKKKFGIGDEEKSGFSLADVPDMPQAIPSYADIDAVDVDAAMGSDMPDDAFADNYFNPEEVDDERKYPLYASPADYVKGKPHPGLIKAALQAHADGKIQNPKSALQRLKVAHSQLHGAKSMDDKEKMATEMAQLQSKLTEVQAAVENKDTELASLKDQNAKLLEEVAAYKSAAEAKASEELAAKRLAELAQVEGFSVKDEEKASLLESLKTEDQLAFENRVLKVRIASMEEAAKKKPTAATEEEAHLLARVALGGLDFVPNGLSQTSTIDILSIV